MNMKMSKCVFPDSKAESKRNFIKENVKHVKYLQGDIQDVSAAQTGKGKITSKSSKNERSKCNIKSAGVGEEMELRDALINLKQTQQEELKEVDIGAECPPGYVLLPQEKRELILRVLQQSYAECIQELNSTPAGNNMLKLRKRKGELEREMKEIKEGFEDLHVYVKVTKVRPTDKDARMKYNECNKIVKKIAFEKAISVTAVTKTIADSINLDAMTIENEYKGPELEDGKVTLDFMKELMELFKNQGKLHRKYAYKILLDVKSYFMEQPSLVDIKIGDEDKFTVCGDIHGQYYDLMNIFDLNGLPSTTNPYLFNGDFVDRGSFSVECIFTLFGFKLLYPNHFYMSRGNHESVTMNQIYGFYGEVKAKYTAQMADLFTEVYNWLPLAHCLNDRVLVMHGGLFSQDNVTLETIRGIDRNRQPPEDGPMCELLWSDPQPQNGRAPSKRGTGCQFGPDVTKKFLELNNLDYIIRSHEVKNDGYEVAHDGKCITVFSAPNYCDTMGNKGAFITLNGKDMKPKFTTYEAVPHPKIIPMAYASLANLMS